MSGCSLGSTKSKWSLEFMADHRYSPPCVKLGDRMLGKTVRLLEDGCGIRIVDAAGFG
jgi:hypothetical protein